MKKIFIVFTITVLAITNAAAQSQKSPKRIAKQNKAAKQEVTFKKTDTPVVTKGAAQARPPLPPAPPPPPLPPTNN